MPYHDVPSSHSDKVIIVVDSMKRPKTLSAAFVKTVTEPGRYGDGRGSFGLSLLLKATRNGRLAKSWSQRLRQDGKPFNVGLGRYPLVTLSEARLKALKNARDNAAGRSLRGDAIPTFRVAVDAVIALHQASWRGDASEREWRGSLEKHAFPILGDKPVDEITTGDVLSVLAPIWSEKHETAKRILQRISIVLRWAIAQGHRTDDPTHAATAVLPRNGTGQTAHHAAMPHGQVGDAIKRIRALGAPSTTLCLEFLILTAARSGEARGARWSEIDMDAREWRIPAERMKTARPHRVPLSGRALAILCEARQLSGGSELVFPSSRGGPLHGRTLGRLLADAGIEGSTVHGFRSSFRDWCGDSGQPREVAESALAHTVSGVEGAYFRSDLYLKRQVLMQEWADYISGITLAYPVITHTHYM